MLHRHPARARRVLLTASALGAAGALIAAPAATAATATVTTSGWDWIYVFDSTLGVSDAEAFHRDVLGSGVDLKGWTEDAFDAHDSSNGYLSGVGFDHSDPGLSGYLSPVPVSFVHHPDGGATIVSEVTDNDLGGGATLDAVFTLEIAGSFARWTIEVDDGGSGLVEALWGDGELGSPTAATPVGDDGLVVTGPTGLGPVIGLHVDSDGVSEEIDGTDPEFPSFVATGASTVVFTVALLDYDPCAEADAAAQMAALVPDLATHFGEDLPPVLSDCVQVEAPSALKVGEATDQLLELTLTGDLAGGHPRLDGETYFDYVDLWTSGLDVLAANLPAGLTLDVVEHPVTQEPALHLTGTPLFGGSSDAPLRLFGIRNDPAFAGEMPVAANLTLEIDGLDLAAPDPVGPPPELADSGVEAIPALVAGGAAMLTGAMLLATTRRRRGRT